MAPVATPHRPTGPRIGMGAAAGTMARGEAETVVGRAVRRNAVVMKAVSKRMRIA